jgi:hypothetical protein
MVCGSVDNMTDTFMAPKRSTKRRIKGGSGCTTCRSVRADAFNMLIYFKVHRVKFELALIILQQKKKDKM